MSDPTRGAGAPAHETYAALLSHELRTPVTSIFAYLQLLEADELLNDPDTLRRYLSVVRGQAADLVRIVSELTVFSDGAGGSSWKGGFVAPEPMSLRSLVDDVVGSRSVRVEVSAEAAQAPVDLAQVRLVLAALVDNAFKFGAAEADVLVRASLEGDPVRLVVRVMNQGPLVPESLRAAIFLPFRQGEAHQTRLHGGLGLGLTVAQRAAEGAGGLLRLEAEPPTTFRLELPLREDPLARQATALREQAARSDEQTLSAMQELRSLQEVARTERHARELGDAQQLRAVEDFRTAHRQALALAQRLDRGYLETISALARAVEARDNYTGGHVERVRRSSLRIAEHRQFGSEDLRQLGFGALLHDVGKIGVPDAVLQKPGPLEPDEWIVMRRHPEIGRRVLEGVSFLASALDAVGCHHERWDGKGYPNGLAGEAIPLFGRIVGVADAYDAMVSDRPYRAGLPVEVAVAEIERGRGTQFDADIAGAFLAAHAADSVRS